MTKFRNGFGSKNLLSDELIESLDVYAGRAVVAANNHRKHVWITVVDPTNRRSLLQACDDCGVVKSENSVIRNCKADVGAALISGSLDATARMAV